MFCINIQPDDISSLFAKYQREHWFDLWILLNNTDLTTVVPKHFLKNHSVEHHINIKCEKELRPQQLLKIHPDAFVGQNATKQLLIGFCDMNATKNYRFLNGFHGLTSLLLTHLSNMDLIDEWAKVLPISDNLFGESSMMSRNDSSTNQETTRTSREQIFAEHGLVEFIMFRTWMSESTFIRILNGLLHSSAD